jgi:hypothetical protein
MTTKESLKGLYLNGKEMRDRENWEIELLLK